MRVLEQQVLDRRYRMVRRVGSGGMADVWLADDTELGRQVALKILHENFARDGEFVERFQREASAAAALQHPNVVGVYDRGRVEDTYYIAMEFVDGSPLRDLISRGLSTAESIEIARQVLTGAEFAHARGIVHRDLKPMNVLIDHEGRVRVTDFGIARAGNSEITRTGSVMGTAQYLSPEQAQGLETTATSDVYSIGVMLFEMLTGRVPFDGDNAVAIAMKQVGEEPVRPSTVNPEIPPALDAVVLKALAKDPADRFPTAAQMREALDAAEADPAVAGPLTERFGLLAAEDEDRHRGWWAAGLLAAIVVGGLLLYLLFGSGGDGGGTRVPGVVGKSITPATLELQRAGFKVLTNSVENGAPEGTVFAQDPRGGEQARQGSTITLSVSAGPAPVEIGDLSGKSLAFARKKLTKAGLKIDVQRRPSGSIPAGRVIETSPAANSSIAPGQTVTVIVSGGVRSVTVPDVVGMDRIDAKATLEQAGFLVTQEAENADAPEDQVVRQIPDANTSLARGDEVTIVYSTGAGSITVDNVVGLDRDQAVQRLKALGLEVRERTETVTESSSDGVVLSQSPEGGRRLQSGDTVSLVIGKFVAPKTPSGGGGSGNGGGTTTTPPPTTTTPRNMP